MRKTNKNETEKLEDGFWQVDYLDSHSVCYICEELGSVFLWCLLCYKIESESDCFVSTSLVFGDWDDLAHRPLLSHAFTFYANKDKLTHICCRNNWLGWWACHLLFHNMLLRPRKVVQSRESVFILSVIDTKKHLVSHEFPDALITWKIMQLSTFCV